MKTVNLLLITARADIGGGPKHVHDLAQYINDHYKNINLFLAAPDDKPYGECYRDIAKSFFLLPHRKFSLLVLLKLMRFCWKKNISVIHSHGRGAGIYSRLLFLLPVKIVHTYHGVHQEQGFKDAIKNAIERILKYMTHEVVFVSKSELNTANSINLTKKYNQIIPNGINTDQIDAIRKSFDRNISKQSFDINPDEIVLGTLTRLDWQKGNDILINHFSKLVDQFPDTKFKLLIAGEGSEKKSLMQQIYKLQLSKKITLLGTVSNPLEFLHAIDIFVSASRGEGLPYALLEAIAMKITPIVSDVTGHNDLLPQEFLFNLTDLESFAEKINKILIESSISTENIKIWSLEDSVKKITSIYHHNFE